MKPRIIAVVLIIFVILFGVYWYKHYTTAEALAQKPPQSATVVGFATAKSMQWQTEVKSIGTINAEQGVALRAEVPGRITQVLAASGTAVKKGMPLFEINPKVLQAQLVEDNAALDLSEFTYNRYQKLYTQRAISLEQLTQAQVQLKVNKAKVASSQERLVLATIHAPFDGTVGLRLVDVGDYVQIGQELATFQSATDMRVDFTVPEQYVPLLKNGETVIVSIPTQQKTFTGTVYAFNPLISNLTRTMDIRAHMQEPGLVPGSFVNVTLLLGDNKSVVVVPQTAVIKSLHGDSIYKVVDGKAVYTTVQSGERRQDLIAITQGIKAGDVVVSVGQMKVITGMPVTDKGAILGN